MNLFKPGDDIFYKGFEGRIDVHSSVNRFQIYTFVQCTDLKSRRVYYVDGIKHHHAISYKNIKPRGKTVAEYNKRKMMAEIGMYRIDPKDLGSA